MSPSIASIVTPLRSPAVLSMSSSFPSRCQAPRVSKPSALLHASRQALRLMLAEIFLGIELPAALLALEDFHCAPPYLVFGVGPLSLSASSTVTLSPFFTFWSAADGK